MRRERSFTIAASVALGGAALAALYRLWASRAGVEEPQHVGYPPLGIPKSVAKDLWIVDDTMVVAGMSLPIRMTIVRLEDGALILHSPVAFTPELKSALALLGSVRHLVAPTTAHWTHLADWQHAFPEATTWAVPGLSDRLQVRVSRVRIDRELGDVPPADWRGEVEQGLLRGGSVFCECYMFHRSSRTLILCDAIQNLEPAKLPPVTRVIASLAGGTRATTAHHVRAALLLDREGTRADVLRMIELDPDRVLLAHGITFEKDAARKLAGAFRWAGDFRRPTSPAAT